MRKKKMRAKKVGNLLIILGIMIFLIPIVGRAYISYRQEQMYLDYLENIDQMEQAKETEVNESKVIEEKKTTPNQVISEEPSKEEKIYREVTEGEVIGKITIKAIDADLLLLEGVKNEQLKLGAGHMPNTALPGQSGNCTIAGHRNYTFGSMFNRLDEVEVGDEVIVEFDGEPFTYKVTEIKIVEPTDLSVTEQDKESKTVTLITCHPIYRATHRLIIKGELEA